MRRPVETETARPIKGKNKNIIRDHASAAQTPGTKWITQLLPPLLC